MTMSGHTNQDDQSLPRLGDLIVGKYRIEKLIGKGGMGAVFSAQHELLGQRVAVKFLLGDIVTNQEAVQRFLNEARNAAKIQSEHVCRVMDVGTAESGLPYMVLEYLEGMDLSQKLEQHGPFGVEEAVEYTLQALEAIAQAHQLGIVHRDLKPANLFLAKRADGSLTVKVLDFGIAKASNPFSEGGNHSLTSTKSMLGSPLYMSPEQLRSAKNVDARADIWALGVIMYELLAGTVPFNGESLGELFIAILEQPPMPIIHKRPDVPQALSDAIMRCLTRQAEQRFQNVAELAHGIASCAPARSYASIERITQTLGMSRVSLPNPQGPSQFSSGQYPQSHAASSGAFRPPSPSYVDTGNRGITGSGPMQLQMGTSQTNGNFGHTSGNGEQKSKAPLFIAGGAAALVAVLVVGLAGYKITHKTAAVASVDAPPVVASATATAPVVVTTPPVVTPPPTVAATETAPSVIADTSKPHNKPGNGTKPATSSKVTVVTPDPPPQVTATAKPTSKPNTPPPAFDPFAGRNQ